MTHLLGADPQSGCQTSRASAGGSIAASHRSRLARAQETRLLLQKIKKYNSRVVSVSEQADKAERRQTYEKTVWFWSWAHWLSGETKYLGTLRGCGVHN